MLYEEHPVGFPKPLMSHLNIRIPRGVGMVLGSDLEDYEYAKGT